MEHRFFGDTDLSCSVLGFGTWEMSTTQYGEIDVQAASNAVNAAIDRGITLFDTAEVYGPYHSEELLAKALGPRRKQIVLVTKVGFEISDENRIAGRNSSYDHIVAHAEGCLKRLSTDWIDLLLIHWPDHNTPYDEPIRALESLKAAGKIRQYGVSNFAPAMMEVCEGVGHLAGHPGDGGVKIDEAHDALRAGDEERDQFPLDDHDFLRCDARVGGDPFKPLLNPRGPDLGGVVLDAGDLEEQRVVEHHRCRLRGDSEPLVVGGLDRGRERGRREKQPEQERGRGQHAAHPIT